jgi:hypothetical protein
VTETIRSGEPSTGRLRRRGAIPTSGSSHRSRQSTSGAVGVANAERLGQTTTVTSSSSRPSRNQMAPPPQPLTNSQTQSAWPDAAARGPPTPTSVYPPYIDGSSSTAAAALDPIKWEDETDNRYGSGYSLFCGFEELDTDEIEPYEPSPFPTGWSDDSGADSVEYSFSSCSSSRTRIGYRRSTGCGALIHTNGTPKTRTGTWHAEGRATDAVIFLDKLYFERGGRGGQSKQFACGCRWSGVGCAHW